MYVALLTDFGYGEYVGVLKAEIVRRAPRVHLIDFYHDVAPYDIREAAWILYAHRRSFPLGTVFLCVVDPGVGTERQALAITTAAGYAYVGPDNGLMAPAVWADGDPQVVSLPVPDGASRTFHGRDVFAPAAAHLAAGVPLEALGTPAAMKERFQFHLDGREGEVVRIDRFGNIITNLPPTGAGGYEVTWPDGTRERLPFHPTYAVADPGRLFVTTGAAGTLEIALRQASALQRRPVKVGERIRVE